MGLICHDIISGIIIVYKLMNLEIKRQELMETICSLQVVEKLQRNTLEEFCRVFKTGEGSNDSSGLVRGLQNKLADIFGQEGQAYEDYLQLPKFRVMGQQLNDKLNNLFKQVWDGYHHTRHREQLVQVRAQFDQLTPSFANCQQQQRFHLGMLNLYRESGFCPRKPVKPRKPESEVRPVHPEGSIFPPNMCLQIQQGLNGQFPANMFSHYFPYQHAQQFPKVEAMEGTGYIVDNKPAHAPLFDVPRFPVHSPMMMSSLNQQQEQQVFPGQTHQQQQVQLAGKTTESGVWHSEAYPHNKHSESSQGLAGKMFKHYEFVQCVCEGGKGTEEELSFQCAVCRFCYHFNCMQLDSTNMAERGLTCPICNLRKESLFCTIVKEPLKCCWYLQETPAETFSLILPEELSGQIVDAHNNGLDCQVRFLKIDGRTMRKDRNPLEGYTEQDGVLRRETKYSEITLPHLSQDQVQTIAVEILLSSESDNDKGAKLYFFSVLLTRMRKVEEIVLQLFEGDQCFEEDYYEQFMDESGKVVVLLSDMGHLIKFPVRGADCKHAEVFDLKRYLDRVTDFNEDIDRMLNCEVCAEPCSSFKYDSLIYRCISGFPDYEENEPDAIEIDRNGEIEWVSFPQEAGGEKGKEEEEMEEEGDDQFLQEEESSSEGGGENSE